LSIETIAVIFTELSFFCLYEVERSDNSAAPACEKVDRAMLITAASRGQICMIIGVVVFKSLFLLFISAFNNDMRA
jgi:hypothetical protein